MNVYIGEQSTKMKRWCEKNYGPKDNVYLTLHVQYDAATYGTTTGRIEDADGSILQTDAPIAVAKGSSVILKARPVAEAVEQFMKWTDDETLEADRTVVMDESKELTALFHQNVT